MKQFSHASIIAPVLVAVGLMAAPMVQAQDCEDRVTGGGWITTDSGQKANFGVRGGLHQGELWGHLTYVDHSTSPPMVVRAQEVTAYCQVGCPPDGCEVRRITYANATIRIGNKVRVCDVLVQVSDCGEPGTDDTFAICIPCLDYCEGSVLGGDDKPSGGNIQLHAPDPGCDGAVPVCENMEKLCPCFLVCTGPN